ncbi:hypothetical protein PTSG_08290 [Salpingoeca rosetta]|uniref:Uncharacterized protein n=1 Tax=Salpingoeca rosetta (strain ATCC 50818 / BSB-021) TaxID=946362 RepID=F2UJ99_SALR5|nr:uncharacterized protein PTSG_08290 [Salpingoeca rosetta]EGD77198.1 hypothetical protein PTSG_08290 [Salpingoeca rosetta]|eukprot:XP_004990542.1 hypothetical protein PTSG_08290 [Salpingoeca rosetta]
MAPVMRGFVIAKLTKDIAVGGVLATIGALGWYNYVYSFEKESMARLRVDNTIKFQEQQKQ